MSGFSKILKITTSVSQPHELLIYSQADNMIPWYIITMANSNSSDEIEFNTINKLKVFAGPLTRKLDGSSTNGIASYQRLAKTSAAITLGSQIKLTSASNDAPCFENPSIGDDPNIIKVHNSSGMILPVGIEMNGFPLLLMSSVNHSDTLFNVTDVLFLKVGNRKLNLTLEEAKDPSYKKIELRSMLSKVINIEISQDESGTFLYNVTPMQLL